MFAYGRNGVLIHDDFISPLPTRLHLAHDLLLSAVSTANVMEALTMAGNECRGANATAIVAIVILVIAALFGACYLAGGSGSGGGFTIPTPM